MQTRYTKLISLFFVFLFFSHVTWVQAADNTDAKNQLVLLNWSEYLDPDLVKKFEEQYNVTLKEVYFESDDYRDNYMLETEGKGIDIIVVSGAKLRQYKKQKWIAPLTEKQVPNLKHIDKKWLTMFEGAEGYTVPYFWGTLGIVYREDLVKGEVTSWNDLFQPDEALRGKIAMVAASRDMIGMALKAHGYSANSTSFKELEQAKQLLLQQKPYVNDYTYFNMDENSSLVKGDILMAMAYSGDALLLMEYNDGITYVVPKEGGNVWVDYMVVSNASKNKDIAYKFLDFINQPEHAAQMAEYVYYPTPNVPAEKLLPAEFKADKNIYPPKDVLDKSEAYSRLPPRVTRFRNEIFSRVTQ